MSQFQTVSESELLSVDGGIAPFVAGFIVGSVFVAGVAVGVYLANKDQGSCPAK